jgi:hypothetical protein
VLRVENSRLYLGGVWNDHQAQVPRVKRFEGKGSRFRFKAGVRGGYQAQVPRVKRFEGKGSRFRFKAGVRGGYQAKVGNLDRVVEFTVWVV